MSAFDQDQLVALLTDGEQATPGGAEAVQRHGLAALVCGRAATIAEISGASGLSAEAVRAGVEALDYAGRIEIDGERVVGVGGLTLTPTVHSLALPAASLNTWCALDAVGIPTALGLDASLSTTCPYCSVTLRISIRDSGPIAEGSPRLFCPTGSCDNVRAEFCSAANLFCSSAHLNAWRADNPTIDGHELDLVDAAELGRAMWGRYGSDADEGVADG